jgi:hypothetical protein
MLRRFLLSFIVSIFLTLVVSPFNANAATDPASRNSEIVTELVRLLQDGSEYLMKMVAHSDPRIQEILEEEEKNAGKASQTLNANGTATSTFTLESLEKDLDDMFTNFLSSIDPSNIDNAAQVRIASKRSMQEENPSSEFPTSDPSCFSGWYKPKAKKNAKIFGPQLSITLRAGECRIIKNMTNVLRRVECDSPSIAYAVLPAGVQAKGETAELFAGETCGISEADRDLVEISKADRLISFDDPLVVGLSDFA